MLDREVKEIALDPNGKELPNGNDFLEYVEKFVGKKINLTSTTKQSDTTYGITGSIIASYLTGGNIEDYKESDVDIFVSQTHYEYDETSRLNINYQKLSESTNLFSDEITKMIPDGKKIKNYRFNISGLPNNRKLIGLINLLIEKFPDNISLALSTFSDILAYSIKSKFGALITYLIDIIENNFIESAKIFIDSDYYKSIGNLLSRRAFYRETNKTKDKKYSEKSIGMLKEIIGKYLEQNVKGNVPINIDEAEMDLETYKDLINIMKRHLLIEMNSSIKTHIEIPDGKTLEVFYISSLPSESVNTFHIPHVRGYYNLQTEEIYLTHSAYLAHKFGVFLPNKHYEVPTKPIEDIVEKYRKRGIKNLMPGVEEKNIIGRKHEY